MKERTRSFQLLHDRCGKLYKFWNVILLNNCFLSSFYFHDQNLTHLRNWPVSIRFGEEDQQVIDREVGSLCFFLYAFCNLSWRKIDNDGGGGFAFDLKMHAWLACSIRVYALCNVLPDFNWNFEDDKSCQMSLAYLCCFKTTENPSLLGGGLFKTKVFVSKIP